MSTSSVQMFSDAVGKWIRYNVILPDVGEGPFPVLMQLHGLSDDCDAWIQRSNLVRHVANLPLVVVLPDGGTSFYLNWTSGGDGAASDMADHVHRARYEDCLMTDIPAHVMRHFNVTDGPWAIGGLSMGGGGSMRLGLRHADRFKSIWSHSSKFVLNDRGIEPRLIDPADADIEAIVRAVARMPEDQRPTITFDCGTEDFLIDENRWFHQFMTEVGLEHQYLEYPGEHEWGYWDTHVQEALVQHGRVLGFEPIDPWAKTDAEPDGAERAARG